MGDQFRAGARVAELDTGTVAAMREQSGALLDEIKLDAGMVNRGLFDMDAIKAARDSYQGNFASLAKTDPAVRRMDNIVDQIEAKPAMSADELITLRSDVRELQLKKDGGEARALSNIVAELDKALEAALEANPNSRFTIRDYNTANARFRLARALDAPGVIGKDGKISVASLANRMKQYFKSEYGANDRFGTFDAEKMGDAGPTMSRLFDVTKAMNRFPRYLSDSGTSQRLSLSGILDSTTETATAAITRLALPRWIARAQLSPDELRGIIEQLAQADETFRAGN